MKPSRRTQNSLQVLVISWKMFLGLKKNLYKIIIKTVSFPQNHWLGGHSDPAGAGPAKAEEAILSYVKLSSRGETLTYNGAVRY